MTQQRMGLHMLNLPQDILIEDAFLRDGLQNEPRLLSVDEKLRLLNAIEDAGVRRIQIGSFVHPKIVPQMANTDALFEKLAPKRGVVYSALVFNKTGLARAKNVGAEHLSISVSASETHSQKNTRKSVQDARLTVTDVIESALQEGIKVRAGIQSALGCAYEGRIEFSKVIEIAKEFAKLGVSEINIADTAGLATPMQVYSICRQLTDLLPDVALSLHLHDTRGMGIANMLAGLQAGVQIFDASMGGLGGCPFIPKATGNISTEDAAFLCSEMGIETGVDWTKFRAPVAAAEKLLGHELPGKASHVASPKWVLEGDAA